MKTSRSGIPSGPHSRIRNSIGAEMSKTEDLEMESDKMMKNEPNANVGTPPTTTTHYRVILILVVILTFILFFFTILQFVHNNNSREERTLLTDDVGNLSSQLENLKQDTIYRLLVLQEDLTSQLEDLKQGSIYSLHEEQGKLSLEQNVLSVQLELLNSHLKHLKGEMEKVTNCPGQLETLKGGMSSLSNDVQRISGAVGRLAEEKRKARGPTTPLCETHWAHYGLSCYYKSWKSESWDAARRDCQHNMSDLVVINGEDEMDFLYHFSEQETTWIGLQVKDGSWEWVDSTSYKGTSRLWQYDDSYDWLGEEEGGDECAYLDRLGQFWRFDKCSHKLMYICENKRILL